MIRDFSVGRAPNAIEFYPDERMLMPTIKMRVPENFGGLSIGGYALDVKSDGSCMVDHRDIDTVRAHGFVPWPADVAKPNEDVQTMTRGELIDHALGATRNQLEGMETEDIRRACLAERGDDVEDLSVPTDAELAAAKVEANSMTPEHIGTMKRNEMFAYLKAEGVTVSPPITNDKLREIALETLERKKAA